MMKKIFPEKKNRLFRLKTLTNIAGEWKKNSNTQKRHVAFEIRIYLHFKLIGQ